MLKMKKKWKICHNLMPECPDLCQNVRIHMYAVRCACLWYEVAVGGKIAVDNVRKRKN